MQDFRLLMGGEGQIRGNLRELFRDKKVVDGLVKVAENIDFLSEVAKKSLGRSEMLDKIFERLAEVKVQLKKLMDTSVTGYCYWYEANGRSFGLHITPLMVADKFGEQLKNQQIGWVFTSATLEVGANSIIFVNGWASKMRSSWCYKVRLITNINLYSVCPLLAGYQ